MNSPHGKTMFGGRIKPAVNFVERKGDRIGSVVLVKPGFAGAWFGRCEKCGTEALYSKEKIRRKTVRCEICQPR